MLRPHKLSSTVRANPLLPPGCGPPNKWPSPLYLDPDNRTRFKGERSQYPWRAFARIDGLSPGSGVFIGPKHVLTAAHVVFDCQSPGNCVFNGKTRVYFGDGDSRAVERLIVPDAWFFNGGAAGVNADYALIVVREDGKYSPGYFSFGTANDAEIANLRAYGFPTARCKDAPVELQSPSCKPWGQCGNESFSGRGELYGTSMNVWFGGGGTITGPCQSQSGQSGSGFYYEKSGNRRVVGVLHGTVEFKGQAGQMAIAKRLGPESTAQIAWWISQFPHSLDV